MIGGITFATTNAYVGQTIVINGSGFGATKGTSTVAIDGVATNPTAWSETQIITSVPSGVSAGNVVVTVGGDSANNTISIATGGVVIDDVEGGSVGTWATGLADSGYYAYGQGITPDNSSISTDGPQASAAHSGARGMRVMYSFVSGFGGGWGAKLANTLNLSAFPDLHFHITWDGSSNDVKFSVKDADGTSYAATVSNITLNALGGYGRITVNKASFSYDADGSEAGANTTLDWAQVNSYNITYPTMGTSTAYQSIDSIGAGNVDWGGSGEVVTGEVIITNVDPAAGPAGTKFTAIGSGFGASQGQSVLVFENNSTHTTYQCEVLSWSDTAIEAIVPKLAPAGNYTLKVIRLSIAQGTIQAFESNPAAFRVTSGSSSTGQATIYPNPFNPLETSVPATRASGLAGNQVTIAYDAAGVNNVGIYIYDATAKLVYRTSTSDQIEFIWDGKDMNGSYVADGLYLLRVVNQENKAVIAKGKILVIKR